MKPRPAAKWDALSASYRARLERRGITRARYLSGVPLAAARGHAITPEHPGRVIPWIARARRNGIISDTFIPAAYWQQMTAAEQAKASHDYMLAYFEKGQGTRLTREERRKRGLLPTDRNVYRHRSHAQEVADVEFQQLMVNIHGRQWGRDEWSEYRSQYYATFSTAA